MQAHALRIPGAVTLALLAYVSTSTLGAQTANVASLPHPLAAIRFQIGRVDSVAIVFGVDTSALRTAIEQRLRAAMLKVQSRDRTDSSLPTLVLRLSIPQTLMADRNMDFFALAQLELWPAPSSKPGSASRAPIWSSTGLARRFATLRGAAAALPDMAKGQLDEFIAAFGYRRGNDKGEIEPVNQSVMPHVALDDAFDGSPRLWPVLGWQSRGWSARICSATLSGMHPAGPRCDVVLLSLVLDGASGIGERKKPLLVHGFPTKPILHPRSSQVIRSRKERRRASPSTRMPLLYSS